MQKTIYERLAGKRIAEKSIKEKEEKMITRERKQEHANKIF